MQGKKIAVRNVDEPKILHIALLTHESPHAARIPCAPIAHLRSHAARSADASALDSAAEDEDEDEGSGVRQMRM